MKKWKKKYEINKEIIYKKVKKYYENNKEVLNKKNKEKIKCDCGCEIRKHDLARHKKTKKYIDLMS